MKKFRNILILAAAVAAVALAGCASNPEYAQYTKAQTDIATAKHAADAAKYKAMSDIAVSGDNLAKNAAIMALALGQTSGAQSTLQAPTPNAALQWAQVLAPSLTQLMGIAANARVSTVQSNNSARVAESTNGAFVGIAGLIQAAPTVTTTTTTDRHDVVSPAPVIAPVVPLVPVVVTPINVTPPVVITPVVAP